MINLPVEILPLVFTLLTQRDQLECMTVCRQWYNTIHYHSLFNTIYIDRQQQFEKLIERVESNPILGLKVECLALSLPIRKTSEIKDLVELFPNLRECTIRNSDLNNNQEKTIMSCQDHPWCEQLEKLIETHSDFSAKTLLYSGLCKNLTYLVATGPYAYLAPTERFPIEQLSNAPALKHLELRLYFISLQDLESLHLALPSLKSLSLVLNDLVYTSFPLDIESAISIKSLYYHYNSFGSNEEYIRYFLYIRQKYTHVEDLELQITSGFLIELETFEATEELRALFTSYLKILGPRLKSLSINDAGIRIQNLFKTAGLDTLDECGCQIKTLGLYFLVAPNLLRELAGTTQVNYIQSLTIAYFGLKNLSMSLDPLKYFKALKDLTISFSISHDCDCEDKHKLNLVNLFKTLGNIQLETLRRCCVELDAYNSSIGRVYPSLKDLTFKDATLKKNVDIFISESCPNLKRLHINECDWKWDCLMFSKSDLLYLELKTTTSLQLLVTTLDNDQQRLYTTSRDTYCFGSALPKVEDINLIHPYVHTEPFDKTMKLPHITIVCKSIKDVFFLNTSKEHNILLGSRLK